MKIQSPTPEPVDAVRVLSLAAELSDEPPFGSGLIARQGCL